MSTLIEYPPELGPRLYEPPTLPVEERTHALRNFLIFAAAFLLLMCVITSTVTILLVRSGQKDGHKTLDTINDCTTSTGACYLRQQEQIQAAIAKIAVGSRAAAAAAAACATSLQQHGNLPANYSEAFKAISQCQQRTLSTGSR